MRRACTRASVSCNARRAKPKAAAPTVDRNTSSTAIATLNPSPAWPINAASDTITPSSRNLAKGCGAITSNRSATDKPATSAGIKNADNPRAPGASPVRAKIT